MRKKFILIRRGDIIIPKSDEKPRTVQSVAAYENNLAIYVLNISDQMNIEYIPSQISDVICHLTEEEMNIWNPRIVPSYTPRRIIRESTNFELLEVKVNIDDCILSIGDEVVPFENDIEKKCRRNEGIGYNYRSLTKIGLKGRVIEIYAPQGDDGNMEFYYDIEFEDERCYTYPSTCLTLYKETYENKIHTEFMGYINESSKGKPYKTVIEDGYEILVGRNAESNDILTFDIADDNDIWMHVKGVPGSHVVIKVKEGETTPEGIIRKAAHLAAQNSKALDKCQVVWTRRKNVNKESGHRPGQVSVDYDKSHFITLNK